MKFLSKIAKKLGRPGKGNTVRFSLDHGQTSGPVLMSRSLDSGSRSPDRQQRPPVPTLRVRPPSDEYTTDATSSSEYPTSEESGKNGGTATKTSSPKGQSVNNDIYETEAETKDRETVSWRRRFMRIVKSRSSQSGSSFGSRRSGALVSEPEAVIDSFAFMTSCHGLSRAMSHRRNACVTFLWWLVLLTSLFTLISVVSHLMDEFYEYPMRTTTSFLHNEKLPFPTVTICSLSELDLTKANDLRRNVENPREKLAKLFFSESIWGQSLYNLTKDGSEDLLDLDKSMVYTVTAPTVADLMFYCSFDGVAFPCAEEFNQNAHFQHCYEFNRHVQRNSTSPGPRTGLRVIGRYNTAGHVVGHMMADGLKVIIHKDSKFINPHIQGSIVKPGSTTFMKLEYFEEKNMHHPYKMHGRHYCNITAGDRDACVFGCIYRKVADKCNCSDRDGKEDMDHPLHTLITTKCTMWDYFSCFRPTFDEQMNASYSNMDEPPACGQSCPYQCDVHWYQTRDSQASFPSEAAREHLSANSGVDLDTYNYLELMIFFDGMTKTKTSHTPYFEIHFLIGIVGGTLSLFLGISLITLLEFVELLLYGATVCLCKVIRPLLPKRTKGETKTEDRPSPSESRGRLDLEPVTPLEVHVED